VSTTWRICPILGMRDVRAALDTFTKQLGFRLHGSFEPDAREGMVYAILSRDGAEIHLQIRRHAPATALREGFERSAYIRVEDADALHADLVARGARILEAPHDQPYGMRELAVAAPEGHVLAFGSELRA
jgi:catechol 2,3-dioxygenase-like lactoylglutathione lyase family enzyme